MDIVKSFLALVNLPALLIMVILMVIDWLAGIVLALKTGTFKWSYLANFVKTNVVFQAIGFVFMALVGAAVPTLYPITIISWTAIDATLIADIIIKIKVFGGTPPTS